MKNSVGLWISLYIHTYITLRPFLFVVGRNHFLPLATILTNTFRFFHCQQISQTRSPVSGTPDPDPFLIVPQFGQEMFA
jgi:hypothetical protein